jgi:hypothetical protein
MKKMCLKSNGLHKTANVVYDQSKLRDWKDRPTPGIVQAQGSILQE